MCRPPPACAPGCALSPRVSAQPGAFNILIYIASGGSPPPWAPFRCVQPGGDHQTRAKWSDSTLRLDIYSPTLACDNIPPPFPPPSRKTARCILRSTPTTSVQPHMVGHAVAKTCIRCNGCINIVAFQTIPLQLGTAGNSSGSRPFVAPPNQTIATLFKPS